MKRRLDFEAFHSAQIARQINVSKDGKLGLQIPHNRSLGGSGNTGQHFRGERAQDDTRLYRRGPVS
jgi:hypothetical protein